LTWHHFDPPYEIEEHNRPEGMIALCHSCHAGAKNYDPAFLKHLKQQTYTVDHATGSFASWQHQNILVRLGGMYSGGANVVVALNGKPVVTLAKNEFGVLSLSFELMDKRGVPLVKMTNNDLEFCGDRPPGKFTAAAQKSGIKVWFAERDIGLELKFERISLAQLSKKLAADKERAESSLGNRNRKTQVARLNQKVDVRDSLGENIAKWAMENCSGEDGLIAFLDFKNLSLFKNRQRLRFLSGLAVDGVASWKYCFAKECATSFDL
jgi:hypothetical protein